MKILANQTNVNAPDANYPKGSTRDKVGGTPGTVGGVGIFGDYIQFFQTCVQLSGITENDLLDNVTNGFQVLEAVVKAIGNTFEAYVDNDGSIDKSKGVEVYTINKSATGTYEIVELINQNNLFQRYKIDVTIIQESGSQAARAVIFQPPAASAISVRCYDDEDNLIDSSFFLTITKF